MIVMKTQASKAVELVLLGDIHIQNLIDKIDELIVSTSSAGKRSISLDALCQFKEFAILEESKYITPNLSQIQKKIKDVLVSAGYTFIIDKSVSAVNSDGDRVFECKFMGDATESTNHYFIRISW